MGIPRTYNRPQRVGSAKQSLQQLASKLKQFNVQVDRIMGQLPLYADSSEIRCRLFEQAIDNIYRDMRREWKSYFGSHPDEGTRQAELALGPEVSPPKPSPIVTGTIARDARAEYNLAAESASDELRQQWLQHPRRVRVTAPSRELAASPLYNPEVQVELVEVGDGMFIMVNENGRDLLFPNFRIKSDQRMILSYCFLVRLEGVDGLASAQVRTVEKPAHCERQGGKWILREEGVVVVGPLRQ